jgi:hypothetical protein
VNEVSNVKDYYMPPPPRKYRTSNQGLKLPCPNPAQSKTIYSQHAEGFLGEDQ